MKRNRSLILWIPRNGTGKIYKFSISPSIIRVFLSVILACVVSVPFFEAGVHSLVAEIYHLQHVEQSLNEEILSLQYVKKSLKSFEEKDEMLRNYFGLEKYQSLEPIIVGGGEFNFERTMGELVENKSQSIASNHNLCPVTKLTAKLSRLQSNHEILNQLIIKQEELWKHTPSIMPVDAKRPKITSGFGWRNSPFSDRSEFHAGIDIIGPAGTNILAPANGIVTRIGYDRWLGNYLVLQHTDEIKTIYGHLEDISAKKGERVKRHDVLAMMGNTGMSTSRHLHYAVIVDNRVVDPMQYILSLHR
ncbi:MAG: M23 family metallopeptidase [Deltaproteobacteria bacterium]|nr:M23 family metallopeptidase [Deltaproteobacteria bacterium]